MIAPERQSIDIDHRWGISGAVAPEILLMKKL
jgi:hypothetical protein